jgi:hypothetical protein
LLPSTLTARSSTNLIRQRHGRFVNSAGDSVLAEFASVVEAVNCAEDIQTTLKAENAKLPPKRRTEFRIGVNLGDVMVEGDQIPPEHNWTPPLPKMPSSPCCRFQLERRFAALVTFVFSEAFSIAS